MQPTEWKVLKIHLPEKTLVEQDDLIVELALHELPFV
jgi:hypothetical protein